jgi:hypothetical protein
MGTYGGTSGSSNVLTVYYENGTVWGTATATTATETFKCIGILAIGTTCDDARDTLDQLIELGNRLLVFQHEFIAQNSRVQLLELRGVFLHVVGIGIVAALCFVLILHAYQLKFAGLVGEGFVGLAGFVCSHVAHILRLQLQGRA